MKIKILGYMFLVILLCFSTMLSCSRNGDENGTEQEDMEDIRDIEDAEDEKETEDEESLEEDTSSESDKEEELDSNEQQEEEPIISDEEIIQRAMEIENLEVELFDEKNLITESEYLVKHKTIQDREQLKKYFEKGYSSEVAEMMTYYYMDDEGYLIPGESTRLIEFAEEVEVVEKTSSTARIKAVVEMFEITETHYINMKKIEGTWKIVD